MQCFAKFIMFLMILDDLRPPNHAPPNLILNSFTMISKQARHLYQIVMKGIKLMGELQGSV